MLRGKITLASIGHELPFPACSWRRIPGAVFLIGLWFVYITVLPVSLSLVLGNHSAAILLKGLILIVILRDNAPAISNKTCHCRVDLEKL